MPTFPFLIHPHNDKNHTYPTLQHVNVRQIRNRDDPKIGFIGFNGPGLGVILPLAERQSLLFTSHLLNLTPTSNLPLTPDDEWHHQHVHRSDARVRCRARELRLPAGQRPRHRAIFHRDTQTLIHHAQRLASSLHLGRRFLLQHQIPAHWTMEVGWRESGDDRGAVGNRQMKERPVGESPSEWIATGVPWGRQSLLISLLRLLKRHGKSRVWSTSRKSEPVKEDHGEDGQGTEDAAESSNES
ncbi:hypothetical protein LIA77_05342 [Sarocladium implicatum]|nr:hypothetical protein LIA77_05342 [Sarocladium implicatum]